MHVLVLGQVLGQRSKNNDKFMFQGSLDNQETLRIESEQDVEINEGGSTSVGSTDSTSMDYSHHTTQLKVIAI